VFSVSHTFVCGCHNISTLPSFRTIPGLPGSHTPLPHRVARTHLGTMSWNPNAFASIVQARPLPIFGRPVHHWDSSLRLQPGGSPQALQTLPHGRRPALRNASAREELPPRLDINPGPRVEWDFNPPETCAARHTLWPLLTSADPSEFLTKPIVPRGQICRPPRVRVTASTPHPPHLLGNHLMAMGFVLSSELTLVPQPLMRFVFLGSELCLRLPSDPTSRWTPLPSASSFRHQDLQGTSTPKPLPMPGTLQ